MPRTIEITPSYTSSQLRRLASSTKDANQSRRLLSIAAVQDGMGRADAARIGGMDRQTLRDWVHRFNARGPAGLMDNRRRGNPRRLSPAQQAELAQIVETGPDRAVDGVVRWRRVDLQRVIEAGFGVEYHDRVFDDYDAIIDASCDAWRKLLAQPPTITSIGMRDWAHEGHL